MSRIAQALSRAAAEDRAALVVYLCAGDPSLQATGRLVVAASEAGADIVEIGMPFSDPTADGPAIQRASERALRAGASVPRVLDVVRDIRPRTSAGLLLFGYYNPILAYGEARLAADAHDAGVDGLLVVDLPPEECGTLREASVARGLDFVPLVAPTSTDARIAAARRVATSLLYYVSLTGVTGAAGGDLRAAAVRAGELAREGALPVAVGFGVRTPDDVAVVAQHADAVVVGSAIVQLIERSKEIDEAEREVRGLVARLAAATRRTAPAK